MSMDIAPERRPITAWDRMRAEVLTGTITADEAITKMRERVGKGRLSMPEFERRVAELLKLEAA